jgi:sulfite reductase (NADPH) hemoprotein beta-component
MSSTKRWSRSVWRSSATRLGVFSQASSSEDEFRHLRLRNGLYIQRHAPMLRVAIPYGLLSSTQLRTLGSIARRYDRGYGHFTTRQNIQYNWPRIEDVPDILADLAAVEMHAIQTSGNCIRNVTSDPLAGVAPDELEDPRPWCEIIRQWSTFHPEFTYLPRKFKIAVTGAPRDRAASQLHDIGVHIARGPARRAGLRDPGGRRSRPHAHHRPGGAGFLPREHLLSYLEAILRVYNREGRRDNIHKARIKILVKSLGIEEFRRRVEAEWASLIKDHGPRTPVTRRSSGARLLHPAFLSGARGHRSRGGTGGGVSRLVPLQHARAQDTRLPYRVHIVEKARRGAGRCDRRADGSHRGSRRSL